MTNGWEGSANAWREVISEELIRRDLVPITAPPDRESSVTPRKRSRRTGER